MDKVKGNLFVALTFSKEEVDKIYKHLEEIVDDKEKLVSKDKMHLTLVYIGKNDKVEVIIEALNDINLDAFEIKIGEIYQMPKVNVYVLNIEESTSLNELQEFVEKKMYKAKIAFDKKERFIPHITISRKKIEYKKVNFKMNLNVSSFDLIASIPCGQGVRYEILFTKNLKR